MQVSQQVVLYGLVFFLGGGCVEVLFMQCCRERIKKTAFRATEEKEFLFARNKKILVLFGRCQAIFPHSHLPGLCPCLSGITVNVDVPSAGM